MDYDFTVADMRYVLDGLPDDTPIVLQVRNAGQSEPIALTFQDQGGKLHLVAADLCCHHGC